MPNDLSLRGTFFFLLHFSFSTIPSHIFKDNNQTAPPSLQCSKQVLSRHHCVSNKKTSNEKRPGKKEKHQEVGIKAWQGECLFNQPSTAEIFVHADKNGNMKTANCEHRDWFKSFKLALVGISTTTQPAFTNHPCLSQLSTAPSQENVRTTGRNLSEALSCKPRQFFLWKSLYPSLAAITFPLITLFSSSQGTLLML